MDLPPGYRAERISSNNFSDFIEIHRKAFNSKIGFDFAKNKFDTLNLSGIENIGFIIYYTDNLPVAFYGVYPVLARINDKNILVAQSGDTMTIPEHTGLGLFIYSATITNKLCKQNGIKGIFGFPSAPSFRTFKKKLNWSFNEKINKYLFKIPVLPIGLCSLKIKPIRSLYLYWVKLVLKFYRKSEPFEGSITSNGQNGILRNKDFWYYKLAQKDVFLIKIKNTEVVIKTNGVLSIGDINITRSTDMLPILRRLKLLAFLTLNIHLIFCTSPGTVLDEKLSRIKDGIKILPVGFLNLEEGFDLSSLKFSYLDFDTF
jgi:hypothetical protein